MAKRAALSPKRKYGTDLIAKPGPGLELVEKRTRHSPRLATPEPGSLMLLSTGLMGIAGMVRRKLLRGKSNSWLFWCFRKSSFSVVVSLIAAISENLMAVFSSAFLAG